MGKQTQSAQGHCKVREGNETQRMRGRNIKVKGGIDIGSNN